MQFCNQKFRKQSATFSSLENIQQQFQVYHFKNVTVSSIIDRLNYVCGTQTPHTLQLNYFILSFFLISYFFYQSTVCAIFYFIL